MFAKYIIGLCGVLLLVSFGISDNVQARFFDAFSGAKKITPHKTDVKLTSCEEGAQSLKAQGFTHVFATDCVGIQYRYNGFKKSIEYSIVFNAHNGSVTKSAR